MSFVLAPNPLWYFSDFFAEPLSGGYMKTLLASNPTQNKAVYSDAGGLYPWPDPIPFGANGMQGPLYFNTDVPYRLEIYDSIGILQKVIDPFTPPSTGGGNVTTYTSFSNLLINTQFLYPQPNPAASAQTALIAPSACDRLFTVDSTIINGNIAFTKSNTSATDQVSIVPFSLGTTPPEASPEYYVNYTCSVAGSGELVKDFLYFIKDVRSLENQTIACSFSALSPSLNEINVSLLQNFGTGGSPSASVYTPILIDQVLTASWVKYFASIVVPSAGGKTLGTCGDDYCALVIRMPLDQTSNVSHVNAQVAIGNANFPYDYKTSDQVSSQISKPKTGQIKQNLGAYNEPGWVLMNNGSIGSATSGATTRANLDTFNLFSFLWNNVIDTYAPVSGGRGVSANADFAANKTLTLVETLGRALVCVGSNGISAPLMGEPYGADEIVMTEGQLPSHVHGQAGNTLTGVGGNVAAVVSGGFVQESANTGPTGANEAIYIVQASIAMNFYIKL